MAEALADHLLECQDNNSGTHHVAQFQGDGPNSDCLAGHSSLMSSWIVSVNGYRVSSTYTADIPPLSSTSFKKTEAMISEANPYKLVATHGRK